MWSVPFASCLIKGTGSGEISHKQFSLFAMLSLRCLILLCPVLNLRIGPTHFGSVGKVIVVVILCFCPFMVH